MNIKAVEFLKSILVEDDYSNVELLQDELLYLKFKCYELPINETEERIYDGVEIILHDALNFKGYRQRDNYRNDFTWILK